MDFFEAFYNKCKMLSFLCKKTEKKIFFQNKDIEEDNISHNELVYSSFFNELLDEINKLVENPKDETIKGVIVLMRPFLNNDKINDEIKAEYREYDKEFCEYIKEFKSFKNSCNSMKKQGLLPEDNTQYIFAKALFSFQYIKTSGSNEQNNESGLKMPVFVIKDIFKIIPEAIRERQRTYQTAELLRALSSLVCNFNEPKPDYELFFKNYIENLIRKYKKQYTDKQEGLSINQKNKIKNTLKEILRNQNWKDKKFFLEFERFLDDNSYEEARKFYNIYCECNEDDKIRKSIDNLFIELQLSFSSIEIMTTGNEENNNLNTFDAKDKELYEKKAFKKESKTFSEPEEDFFINQYTEVYKYIAGRHEKLCDCINKYVKKANKNNNYNNLKLTDIKRKMVLYILDYNEIIEKENLRITNKINKDTRNENKIYDFKSNLILDKDIIEIIKEHIRNDFDDSYLKELQHFHVIEDNKDIIEDNKDIIEDNKDKKSFHGDYVSKYLESFKEQLEWNRRAIGDEIFVKELISLIDLRIGQIQQIMRTNKEEEKKDKKEEK